MEGGRRKLYERDDLLQPHESARGGCIKTRKRFAVRVSPIEVMGESKPGKTERTMKPRRNLLGIFSVVGLLCHVIELLGAVGSFPRPVAVRAMKARRSASCLEWRALKWPTGGSYLLLLLVLLAAVPAWAGQPALPAGVPNIFDPEVRAHFQPVAVTTLQGNADFPVLLLLNTAGEQPQAVVLALDARNGKETWSLVSDPIILIVVFADPTTIQWLYVDAGFVERGEPSGSYIALADPNSSGLPDLPRSATTGPMVYM